MRRELEIALRSRATWIVAALGALLVGHGFVLSIDLFSASSRSAMASALQMREMDPLAGIVRPTLGGLDLSLVLLGPLVAARPLAIEKERGTFGALCLAVGSPARVVVAKATASFLACGLLLASPLIALVGFRVAGGHVDPLETAVAFGGELLRLAVIVGASTAAATWTATLAQAATLGIAVALTSWAIDAAEGFAALAWLGGAAAWSLEQKLAAFQKGIVPIGSLLWLSIAAATAMALAFVGASFEQSSQRKAVKGIAVTLLGAGLLAATTKVHRAYDWTERRRMSLPPAIMNGLRTIDQPIAIDVYLDRDDSRRRQVESDVLAKLVLARSDIVIRTPLDESSVTEAQRDADYGRLTIRVGDGTRETRSTSRKEIVTLIFEAAGRPLPEWNQPEYPGYPIVLDGARRQILVIFAYVLVPVAFLLAGAAFTRRRTVP